MKSHGRVDANQLEIVQFLRAFGASVTVSSSLGNGFPDLIVGFRGKNYLMEVKDGSKIPSKQALTPAERKFFDEWAGQKVIVRDKADAARALGVKW